jgi:flagellum-specific ATP synthase
MAELDLAERCLVAAERVRESPRFEVHGRVTRVIGQVVEASSLDVALGELCRIESHGRPRVTSQVVGFHERGVLLMPLGELEGIHPGATVRPLRRGLDVQVGDGLVGRVVDGLGRPIDGLGPVGPTTRYALSAEPPHPLERTRIQRPLGTGVRALDGLITLGRGQRIGIMAGSGVGKSVLLGMMARRTTADVNVIALLGERGREVREFIERDLGTEGLRRSVVVVATSDQPAVIRATGAWGGSSPHHALRHSSHPPPRATRPRCSPSCRACWNAPAPGGGAASVGSTRCWWTATISTSRSPTPRARSWTDTSC